MDDIYLAHYGVMGMKWGVRKDGAPQGTVGWKKSVQTGVDKAATRVTKLNKEERKQKRDIKNKRERFNARRSMVSEKELDAYIRRLEKENRAKKLTKQEVAPGRTKVMKLIEKYGDDVAAGVVAAAVAATLTYLKLK